LFGYVESDEIREVTPTRQLRSNPVEKAQY